MLVLGSVSDRVVLGQAELSGIPALALQVFAELGILLGNCVLVNVGQAEKGDEGRQDAKTGCDPKGILCALDNVITTSILNVREDKGTDKGANLADGGSQTVVTTTHTRRAGLGSQQTNVVAWAKLTESEEDAVHNGKGSNVLGDLGVDTSHDQSNNGLEQDANDEGVLGADPVTDKGTKQCSGKIEHVDDSVPAENGGDGCSFAINATQNGR